MKVVMENFGVDFHILWLEAVFYIYFVTAAMTFKPKKFIL